MSLEDIDVDYLSLFRPTKRLIAVMHDDTVITKDFTPKEGGRDDIYWFDHLETVHRANLVVCIDLKTMKTTVLKNRWGDTGTVTRE